MSTLFNLYDYIFFAFILFFALVGLARGFWIQFLATIVWIAGGLVYYVYGPNIEQGFLSEYMATAVAHWFMFGIIIVGCFFVNFLIRFLLGSLFKMNAFTFFNKIGGLIFGACSSALVVGLVIYAINHSSLSHDSVDWQKSYVVTRMTPIMDEMKHVDTKILTTGSSSTNATNSAAANNSTVSQVANTYEVA